MFPMLRVLIKRLIGMNLTCLGLLDQILLVLRVWQIQSLLLLDLVRSTLLHTWVLHKDIAVASLDLLWRALALVVAEGGAGVLPHARGSDGIVVLGVQSTTDAALMGLVSWVLNLVWWLVNHVLLELSAVLVLHWDRLHRLLLSVHVIIRIWIHFHVLMLILSGRQLMSSDRWPSALVLWMARRFGIGTHWNSVASAVAVLLLHLSIQSLSFVEYLHKLVIDFITVELSQDLFLVLKLVLWLFCLLGSLLFLYKSVCILWLWMFLLLVPRGNQILTVALCSSFRWGASLGLLSVVWLVPLAALLHVLLIEGLSVASHAQILLICVAEVVIVDDMHG